MAHLPLAKVDTTANTTANREGFLHLTADYLNMLHASRDTPNRHPMHDAYEDNVSRSPSQDALLN